jgi:hypothetical protein
VASAEPERQLLRAARESRRESRSSRGSRGDLANRFVQQRLLFNGTRERESPHRSSAERPLSIEAFSKLPTENKGNGDECPVCWEAMDEVVVRLPCMHAFHAHCAGSWLLQKASRCPACDFDIRPFIDG